MTKLNGPNTGYGQLLADECTKVGQVHLCFVHLSLHWSTAGRKTVLKLCQLIKILADQQMNSTASLMLLLLSMLFVELSATSVFWQFVPYGQHRCLHRPLRSISKGLWKIENANIDQPHLLNSILDLSCQVNLFAIWSSSTNGLCKIVNVKLLRAPGNDCVEQDTMSNWMLIYGHCNVC